MPTINTLLSGCGDKLHEYGVFHANNLKYSPNVNLLLMQSEIWEVDLSKHRVSNSPDVVMIDLYYLHDWVLSLQVFPEFKDRVPVLTGNNLIFTSINSRLKCTEGVLEPGVLNFKFDSKFINVGDFQEELYFQYSTLYDIPSLSQMRQIMDFNNKFNESGYGVGLVIQSELDEHLGDAIRFINSLQLIAKT